MKNLLIVLMATLIAGWFGGLQEADAAPGGGKGKADLTTNVQVIDSDSDPVVVGEVVGVNVGSGVVVALAPSLANVDPPLLVVVPVNNPGVSLTGTDVLYYTDAACTTTPYFRVIPVRVYTPSGVIVTSTGATTSYQILKPGTGPAGQVFFNARRDATINNGNCDNLSQIYDAVQADAATYSITLTPPFKMKNP